MPYLHVHVRHLVAKGNRRKLRGLKARPVKPSRQNELWYKTELLRIVKLLRRSAAEQLLPALAKIVATATDDYNPDEPRDEHGMWTVGGPSLTPYERQQAGIKMLQPKSMGDFHTPLQHVYFTQSAEYVELGRKLSSTSLKEIEEKSGVAPVTEHLDPRQLLTVQDYLRGSQVEGFKKSDLEDRGELSPVVRTSIGDILVDGNHRAVMSLFRGEKVRAAVFDIRANKTQTADAADPNVDATIKSMARSFGGIEATAKRLTALAVQKNLQEVDDKLAASLKASVGIDLSGTFTTDGPIRDAIRDATKANIELITSIPEQYFEKLQDTLEKNLVDGLSLRDVTALVSHVADVTESRAKLIARDQTSKMNSAFNRVRQTDLGIEKYQWQTAGDERVRETHAENDGKIFSWDSPPEETGNPGDDINCRCVAIPVFDLEEGPESEEFYEDDEDEKQDDPEAELDNERADD